MCRPLLALFLFVAGFTASFGCQEDEDCTEEGCQCNGRTGEGCDLGLSCDVDSYEDFDAGIGHCAPCSGPQCACSTAADCADGLTCRADDEGAAERGELWCGCGALGCACSPALGCDDGLVCDTDALVCRDP